MKTLNPNSLANLKHPKSHPLFTSENQPANRGRKKNILNGVFKALKDEKVADIPSESEVKRLLFLLAFSSETQIKKVIADKSMPMAARVIARYVLGNKGFDGIMKVIEMVWGKSASVDITTSGLPINNPFAGMTAEELKLEITRLEEATKE